jgi:LmbE family N-acetylglucosaminyl deacetylase
MRALGLEAALGRSPQLLFLGAHCDDIELGCGGTLLELRERLPGARIHWAVMSSDARRRRETLESARRFLGDERVGGVRVFDFRDGYLPWVGDQVKDRFEALKRELAPDAVFTHHLEDRHQDHRLVAELTWNTWRDHLVFEYEIPKYEGDLGRPNLYVPIAPERAERKQKILLEAYASQGGKPWFDAETLRGLLRLRGVECRATWAEAFHARKLVLGG